MELEDAVSIPPPPPILSMKKNLIYFSLIVFSLYFLSGCATVSKIPTQAVAPALQDRAITINSVNYIPLIVVCDMFDYKWSWDTVSRKASIQNKNTYIKFAEGSNILLINDKIEKMQAPAVLYRGALMVPVSFVQIRMMPKIEGVYAVSAPKTIKKGKYLLGKVVIDAGHGGKDPGALGKCGLVEKDVTLDIAKRLKEKLEQEGFDAYTTRSSDKFIALTKRAEIANSCNTDFFVSIHVNAAKIKNAKGFEVYYLSEAADEAAERIAQEENASLKFEQGSYKVNSGNNLEGILWDLVSTENRAESIQLANHISTEAKKLLWVHQRGVKSANFYVLKGARMPAILVEVGFITNREEEEKLKDPDYRDRVAEAIARGILNYREEYQTAEGFTK